MRDYYDRKATRIQAIWKGYITRKKVLNFYERKAYLKALEEKNEIMRWSLK